MTTRRLLVFALAGLVAPAGLAPAADFADPVRMEADGEPIKVEAPGYAAPCWDDIDGDGDALSLLDIDSGFGTVDRVFASISLEGRGPVATVQLRSGNASNSRRRSGSPTNEAMTF